jgi:ribonuclease HI
MVVARGSEQRTTSFRCGQRYLGCLDQARKKDKVELTIYTDGASRNNPGEAGAGIFILQDGEPIQRIARYLGTTTNNIAEYTAAIIGLEQAVKLGASRVTLNADSELLVKQINGQYRVKNEGLKPLYAKVKELIAKINSVEVQYIPREKNKEADALANRAIDEKIK